MDEGIIEEEDKFIYEQCRVCNEAEKTTVKYPNYDPRKFLICAGGCYAICCNCGYRIDVPNTIKREDTS